MLLKIDTSEFPIFCPEMRAIPVYRKIIERNRPMYGDVSGRLKKHNIKELAFIHLYTHPLLKEKTINPYWKHSPEERLKKLIADFEMPEGWKIDDDLQAAIDLYSERVVRTFAMDMLEAAMFAAKETVKYFLAIDYSKRDTRNNFLFDPMKVMKTIQEVNSTIDELDSAMEKVLNQQKLTSNKIRGGGEVGSREVPK